jgi:hypothetical protein
MAEEGHPVDVNRAIRHAWLTDPIIDIHAASRGVYGARRVHAELTLGRGVEVGHGAVELLMRRARPVFRACPATKTVAARSRPSPPRWISSTECSPRPSQIRSGVTDIERHEVLINRVGCRDFATSTPGRSRSPSKSATTLAVHDRAGVVPPDVHGTRNGVSTRR